MQHIHTGSKREQFALLAATRSAQAAKMTLRPKAASDAQPGNEHPQSEQWLFVISGVGEAIVGKNRRSLRRIALSRNSLLLIEKGELHQIKNTGKRSLITINFYVPPAYDAEGEPR
jgi:oxalate decarboxylase/phosphoglucose isomerase-like protein (cupin superfamily)